ncbi:unnamed protein product [Bursaphelenchus xylophilus]|uniref:(pine wood nematode) hypothetical protein n=1 Tax=Bursaphelenchus xylophilus TaxID=6326 RepID=A0A1I7RM52_BURXY|nr:unnamed protein product [Bursaphelenchus xylophilus]CAG9118211.1 unnamed protein product [Bursaphelenchus xylophilus]
MDFVEEEPIEQDADNEELPENMEEVPDESWVTLNGHSKDVFALAVSTDGKRLLSGGEDDLAVFWNLEEIGQNDNLPHIKINEHSDSVVSVAFNGTNTLFSTADMSGKIQIFDAQTGEKMYDVDYCDDLEWTLWHPQADILLAGTSSGQIYVFLLSKKQVEKVKTIITETNAPCSAARLLPGAQNLLAIYGDGSVRLWALKDSSYSTLSLKGAATAVDVHPELPLAAVGTEHGVTHLINTTNMKSVSRFGVVENAEEENSVETIKFAPGYPWLAIGTNNGMLVVYDYETGQARHECAHDDMTVVKCAWWRPDADKIRILSACIDGAIRCWDGKSGEPLLFKCGAAAELFDFTIATVNNIPLIFTACAGGLIRVFKYEESQIQVEEDHVEENDVQQLEEL